MLIIDGMLHLLQNIRCYEAEQRPTAFAVCGFEEDELPWSGQSYFTTSDTTKVTCPTCLSRFRAERYGWVNSENY